MREYEFALVASSDVQASRELIFKYADMLFEAGAEDCTVSSKGNVLVVDFDREANSYEEAVVSAIKPVNSVDERRCWPICRAIRYSGIIPINTLSFI